MRSIESLLTIDIEPVFIIGISLLGVMSLGAGFVTNKVGLLVIRAISGIGQLTSNHSLSFQCLISDRCISHYPSCLEHDRSNVP